jgi:7-cyano-7-deazaguanine synthase
MTKGIVLFSGGVDSTAALFWALDKFTRVFALSVDYKQRHRIEIKLARKLTQRLSVPHKIFKLDLSRIGGSSLTDLGKPLPEFSDVKDLEGGLPTTYVPFRNGLFISLAAAWSEVLGAQNIICGFNIIDSPNYPDTRPSFVSAMEKAVNLGSSSAFGQKKIKIHAPFIEMKKSEIITAGLDLGADFSYSISCYAGDEIPCGRCPSCLLRKQAWHDISQQDPLLMRLKKEGKI